MKKTLYLLILCFAVTTVSAKNYTLVSPNKNLTVNISVGSDISYNVASGDRKIADNSVISMSLTNGTVLGSNGIVSSAKNNSVKQTIPSPLYRSSTVDVAYNELVLTFKGNYGLIFRAYDNGVAYRFMTTFKQPFEVAGERAEFNFSNDYNTVVAYSPNKGFCNSFQNTYVSQPISSFDTTNMAMTPMVVDLGEGAKITISESDAESYPGMFLKTKGNGFYGVYAGVASKFKIHPTRCQQVVEERESFIAKCEGTRSFPWRVLSYSSNDTQLPNHNLVYALAAENRIGDTSWIVPGKVAWDWWNDWGIYGVDFEAGINTPTYMHYIDFASRNGIEYVVLDEGWYDPKKGDMLTVVDNIDLEKLVNYGKSKNVKLILWGVGYSFDLRLEDICKKYSEMGVAGFKIDFFNRDDQAEVERIYRMCEMTAKYKMLIDFHGVFKPSGLNRTYPNAINFEGVYGLEELKWSKRDMTQYDVTMPFIRMMSGPVDYTQGAMRNANKTNFRDIYYTPMSQGTRCHQVATYVVFDSPLVMLCDSPTAYDKEQETVDFITSIPTVWDETIILKGELGQYIVTARRSGENWYIGGLTNWTERDFEIDLNMLKEGNYKAQIMTDGINAHRNGEDYKKTHIDVNKESKLKFHLAPGGGFAVIVKN